MYPPSRALNLDVEAISGIFGSISIACWVVVFTPQIVENFRRKSAEAVSTWFLIIWLAGDAFNIAGAVLQGVLPTMIILAVYYTLADIVLVAQCYWYRSLSAKHASSDSAADSMESETNTSKPPSEHGLASETSPLLRSHGNHLQVHDAEERNRRASFNSYEDSRRSLSTIHEHNSAQGVSHLSPTVPLHASRNNSSAGYPGEDGHAENGWTRIVRKRRYATTKAVLFNLAAILVVCAAGVLGWWLSWRSQPNSRPDDAPAEKELYFNFQGQIYGYICAVLYLASRVPQLWQNYQRKKTEGLSILFFLFACIGNLTFVLSILAYDPTNLCENEKCHGNESLAIYGTYILVNLSWLIGSFGTLLLDLGVFSQFFIYRDNNDDFEEHEEENRRHDTQSDYTDETVVADVYRIQGQRARREQEDWEHQEEGH
ncbi:MAG: hypothetical protein M1822_004182 [Bathelium mastoideum]|nr:MAG: hypothetical protein M1822_004182 [Bathelium mastoideum]